MRRRTRNKKQVKIVIGTALCLLLIMTAGYAAFSTTLSITAKGNIKDYNAAWQLKKTVVTTGDGLYIDTYENDRYIYRGTNPNNYITFNGDVWRIVAVEKDETIKIIKNSPVSNSINFDDNTVSRYSADGWCNDNRGCNLWSGQKSTYDNSGNLVSYINIGNVDYILPAEDSTANRYLNSTGEYSADGFYYKLDDKSKKQIIAHDFFVGPISNDGNIELSAQQEKRYVWKGNVGLITTSDFLKSTANNLSYLESLDNWYWFITAPHNSRVLVGSSHYSKLAYGTAYYGKGSSVGLVPVVHLKSDIKLLGLGTESNPYTIK